jgi:TPR repeat protein
MPMNHLAQRILRALLRAYLLSSVTAAGIMAYAQEGGDASGQHALELFNGKQYTAAKDAAAAGAASGSVVSMYVLGEIYSSGQGAPQDNIEAASWFLKAANAGYAPAINAMGSAREAGRGVEQDLVLAAGWYRQAAETRRYRHEQPRTHV